VQRDSLIEVIRIALVIEAIVTEGNGQVIQVATAVGMSLGTQENGFTTKMYSLVDVISATTLSEAGF
jgi:hypothetical protein